MFLANIHDVQSSFNSSGTAISKQCLYKLQQLVMKFLCFFKITFKTQSYHIREFTRVSISNNRNHPIRTAGNERKRDYIVTTDNKEIFRLVLNNPHYLF